MRYIKPLIALFCLMLLTGNVQARSFQDSRAEKFTFFLAPSFTNSRLLQFENGAEADINERAGLGFGLGYNFNKFIELDLMPTAFTPYIGASIGSTYIDSGIPTGDIGTGCGWDPWWG